MYLSKLNTKVAGKLNNKRNKIYDLDDFIAMLF